MNLSAEWRRLRELDWRELDIKEAGTWPWSLQVACCLLVLGVTCAAMDWYLATPKIEALEEARSEEAQLISDYRRKAAQAARLPGIREQVADLEERLDRLLEMLPSGAEIPALIDDISRTAVEHQLSIETIRLRAPVMQEHYVERPFDIRVRGDYHRIAAFLAGVSALPRIVTQHDFSLVPVEGSDQLELSLLARTYSYSPSARADGEEAAP